MRKTATWMAALAVAAGMAFGTAGISSAEAEPRLTPTVCEAGGGYVDNGYCRGGRYSGMPVLYF